jgi:hypothetical protein
MTTAAAAGPIPVTMLSGFLGSGESIPFRMTVCILLMICYFSCLKVDHL